MRKYLIGTMALATIATLAVAIPAFAQGDGSVKASVNANVSTGLHLGQGDNGSRGPGMMKPFIIGTVASVNGNTLTVTGHAGPGKMTATVASTTYTVDATNAKITKGNATSSVNVSAILVGDNVMVQGTVTGSNVVATMIRDGIMSPGVGFGKGPGDHKNGTSTPAFTGNGEPIVAGTISSISGTSISITNKSNVVYTVDASSAKFVQGNKVSDISVLKVGDSVLVQGNVNGTSVTASSVIDQTRPANPAGKPSTGFLGGIGQFFMHLFGF